MSLDSDIALLQKVDLFDGFGTEELRLLAFGAEARSFAEGSRIYGKGAYSDGGYVVVQGTVDLVSGFRDSVITSYGPGSLIGEMALIAETNNAATALARQNVEVLKIPRPLFRRMLEEYPHLAELLQEKISLSVSEFVNELGLVQENLDRQSFTTH